MLLTKTKTTKLYNCIQLKFVWTNLQIQTGFVADKC